MATLLRSVIAVMSLPTSMACRSLTGIRSSSTARRHPAVALACSCRQSHREASLQLLTATLQSKLVQVSFPRRCHDCRIQLPPHLRVRLAVDRQVNLAELPVRYSVLCYVRVRAPANNQGYLAVEEQEARRSVHRGGPHGGQHFGDGCGRYRWT